MPAKPKKPAVRPLPLTEPRAATTAAPVLIVSYARPALTGTGVWAGADPDAAAKLQRQDAEVRPSTKELEDFAALLAQVTPLPASTASEDLWCIEARLSKLCRSAKQMQDEADDMGEGTPEHAQKAKDIHKIKRTIADQEAHAEALVTHATGMASVVASSATDAVRELASCFQPVGWRALAAMLPAANGGETSEQRWEKWADKAARDGLATARDGRGVFNPYLAGRWMLTHGGTNMTEGKLMKTLIPHVAPHARDKVELLLLGANE
jgi:hypothetical protein